MRCSQLIRRRSGWRAGSGAVWNLRSNALRPRGWTSADAAGLPILPGLVRYDEVAAGAINHAIRFTVSRTQRAYIWPARHQASSVTDPSAPPMGLRLRLKANVDISRFSPANRIILTALKRYGMIVADNGSNWYLSGAPDDRWSNDDLHALGAIPGSDFEVVNTSSLMVNQDSGQARSQSSRAHGDHRSHRLGDGQRKRDAWRRQPSRRKTHASKTRIRALLQTGR